MKSNKHQQDTFSDYNDSSGDEFDSEELLNAGGKLTTKSEEMNSGDEKDEAENAAENEQNGKTKDERKGNSKKDRLRQQFDAELDQTNAQYNATKEEMEKQSKVKIWE